MREGAFWLEIIIGLAVFLVVPFFKWMRPSSAGSEKQEAVDLRRKHLPRDVQKAQRMLDDAMEIAAMAGTQPLPNLEGDEQLRTAIDQGSICAALLEYDYVIPTIHTAGIYETDCGPYRFLKDATPPSLMETSGYISYFSLVSAIDAYQAILARNMAGVRPDELLRLIREEVGPAKRTVENMLSRYRGISSFNVLEMGEGRDLFLDSRSDDEGDRGLTPFKTVPLVSLHNCRAIDISKLSIARVVEMRSDDDAMRKLRNLKRFLNGLLRDGDGLESNLEKALEDYDSAVVRLRLQLHPRRVTSMILGDGALQTLSVSALGGLLARFPQLGAAAALGATMSLGSVLFSFRQERLLAEYDIGGRDVAFLREVLPLVEREQSS